MIISVNEYKPSRRAAKVAKLVAKGMEQKQAEKKVAKRYECIIRMTMPGGKAIIERKLTPARTPSGAREWAEAHGRALLAEAINPTPVVVTKARVPTLAKWWPEFMRECMGRALSDSYISNLQSSYDAWLSKHLGDTPLDQISNAKRSALQVALGQSVGRKRASGVLQALSAALNKAVEHGVIAAMPCKFGKVASLKSAAPREAPFYLHAQYAALQVAAPDTETLAIILLGGDAGMRAGEIAGLEWTAVSFERMELTICKSIWYGAPAAKLIPWIDAGRPKDEQPAPEYIAKLPKHDKVRRVPMLPALANALRKLKLRSRSPRVFTQADGQWLNRDIISEMLGVAERIAKLGRERESCVHVLRHTYCSHLALGGVAPHVIMALAGHHSLAITQRYTHLAPNSMADAASALVASRAAETSPATKRDEAVTG